MKLVFITDGNNSMGMGHVYQSMTLAKYVQEKMSDSDSLIFYTSSEKYVVDLIKRNNFIVKYIENDENILDELEAYKPDRIIFDKLEVSPTLAKNIKIHIEAKLFLFTNLSEANIHADVTVMAGMGSDFKNIKVIEGNTLRFWGPKYWVLRPEFFQTRKSKEKTSKVEKIVLQFGGSDQSNYTTDVLEVLLRSNINFEIKIVLGSAFNFLEDLTSLLDKYDAKNVRIYQNIDSVSKIFEDSDLAFVSPGLSFFEALKMNTAVLCFYQNEFQKQAWEKFIPMHGKEQVKSIISTILEKAFIFSSDNYIEQMQIGEGLDEILDEIF